MWSHRPWREQGSGYVIVLSWLGTRYRIFCPIQPSLTPSAVPPPGTWAQFSLVFTKSCLLFSILTYDSSHNILVSSWPPVLAALSLSPVPSLFPSPKLFPLQVPGAGRARVRVLVSAQTAGSPAGPGLVLALGSCGENVAEFQCS